MAEVKIVVKDLANSEEEGDIKENTKPEPRTYADLLKIIYADVMNILNTTDPSLSDVIRAKSQLKSVISTLSKTDAELPPKVPIDIVTQYHYLIRPINDPVMKLEIIHSPIGFVIKNEQARIAFSHPNEAITVSRVRSNDSISSVIFEPNQIRSGYEKTRMVEDRTEKNTSETCFRLVEE